MRMRANLDFLGDHELVVFHTTWCPDCRRLDQWLSEQGLAPAQVNIDADPQAGARLERETGKRGVPYILVDDRTWVRGYHRERPLRFDPRVLVEELREAVGPRS